MRRKSYLFLIFVFLLAFILRIYKINDISLYGDELTMVYDSYSLLKIGRDQTGESFPLTFSMGAGRPAGYVYFSIPFVALFGPSALGVRSLSIISGLGIVVLIYFLGKRLFSERLGLLASFIVAVSPWSLSLSRGGFEAHFALFLVLLGVVSFLYAFKKPWLFVVSAISWGLAIHTYPTYKLTLPLILLLLVWFAGGLKKIITAKSKKYLLMAVAIGVIFSGLAVNELYKGKSEERFFNINVFSQEDLKEEIVQKINFERTISGLPESISPIFHNKPLEYFKLLKNNYLENFSISYLFLHGDGNPRHNPAETGALYLIELPILIFAIALLYKKNKTKELKFLGIWILITPLATFLFLEQHTLRNAFMFPAFSLLTAVGVNEILEKKRLLLMVIGAWTIQFVWMLNMIYFVAPARHANFWSYPAKKAVEIAQNNKYQYDYIFLSNKIDNIEFAYPVYTRISPDEVIRQQGVYPKVFGNTYIGNTLPDNLSGSLLFIDNYSEEDDERGKGEVVYSKDLTPILFLKR